ncbi:hypothetical protein FACS1894204_07400 [Synergistales bacterium]|nr:hypothetical protein FACS1894204_07400 [Synergistales bacterium]
MLAVLVPANETFKIRRSRPHGHVEAILGLVRKLELDRIISSTPSRERDLVLAMIVSRLIEPSSKLALTKQWMSTTLAEELNVMDATEDELYAAMDWLLKRQTRIETKLASKHLSDIDSEVASVVLYDVSSSSYYGEHCPLVKRGYNRDGLKLPQIVYGILTDKQGCPVTVDVYEGNTSDSTTVTDQVIKLRERFGVERAVLVGDRGMLTSTQIAKLREHEGLGWISCLMKVMFS